MGSVRSSLETAAMLKLLCQSRQWQAPAYFVDEATSRKHKAAVSALTPELAISMRHIEQADFILAMGVDPVNEAPMLAMAMRQAQRKGATVAVIDPRPVSLPLEFIHLPAAPATFTGGIPISQISEGDHPPREFRRDIPGGEPKAAWRVLADLAKAMGPPEELNQAGIWGWLAGAYPVFARLPSVDELPEDGIRLRAGDGLQSRFSPPESEQAIAADVELFVVAWTFGTEELSSYSPHLEQMERPPVLLLHAEDAAGLNLVDGDRIALGFDEGTVQIEIAVIENMAPGVAVLPRHRRLEWQKLEGVPAKLPPERIQKIR